MELTNTITCDIIFTLQNRKVNTTATLPKSYRTNNLIFRGVAKVVSRQFRVLETVGSSPAASTKKTVFDGLFYFVEVGEDENPPGSIIKRSESVSSLTSERAPIAPRCARQRRAECVAPSGTLGTEREYSRRFDQKDRFRIFRSSP